MTIDDLALTAPVIHAINGELSYQETLPDKGHTDRIDHGVEGQLVALHVYANQAMELWVFNPGAEPSLHAIRKVAAICCRTLLKYGCPLREGTPPLDSEEVLAVGVSMKELKKMMETAHSALAGDSNDAEHDAMYKIYQKLGDVSGLECEELDDDE